jgi:hypothetical protein
MMSASISFVDPMISIPMMSTMMTPNMIPNMIPNMTSNIMPMSNIMLPSISPMNLVSDLMQSSNNSLVPINFLQNSQLMSSRNTLQNNLMNNSENFLYIVYEF